MTEYDILLLGCVGLGIAGCFTTFSAVVDGRVLTVPLMMLVVATVLLFLASEEAPGGVVRLEHIGEAFLRLFASIGL